MAKKLATLCWFTRVVYKNGIEGPGPRETGIAVGDDLGDIDVIIDKEGKVVDQPVWQYHCIQYQSLVWFDF